MKISKISSILFFVLSGMLLIFSFQANASLVVFGTRIIYPADKKEISVKVENEGSLPALAQVSIDAGEFASNLQDSDVPFFITPPLVRVEAGSGQVFRIINTDLGAGLLPKDRESLFYFNLLDIPPMPKVEDDESKNYVQLSVQSKLKLFYRPAGIVGKVEDAPKTMSWRMDGNSLKISNPSGYYITFGAIFIKKSDGIYEVDFPMINPMSEVSLELDKYSKVAQRVDADVEKNISDDVVYFYYLSDVGSVFPSQAKLTKSN